MKTVNLTNFKNEFYSEINEQSVEISKLKKAGVSDKTLSAEIYLYNIYGDEIVTDLSHDDVIDEKNKRVEKLDNKEKNMNSEFVNVCQNIEDNEFDKKLEGLIVKVKER